MPSASSPAQAASPLPPEHSERNVLRRLCGGPGGFACP
jgi:hypothetical protein